VKRSVDEHAARFDEQAEDYDDGGAPEYRACAALVVDHARRGLGSRDVVLDLGCGTGAIGLELAPDCGRVVGRDVSEGMMERMREKARERGLDPVEVGSGRFRAPDYDGPVDVVTSNFAMHHIDDGAKREAIDRVAALGPRRVVLGDVMLFGEATPAAPFYDPSVDDPATVGVLADALTDADFSVTAVEMVHDQAGVLVADRPLGPGPRTGTDPD